MTRIQTRISHVHPTASIHQHRTLLRLCYSGVLRAGAPPDMLWRTRVLVTRNEATVERCMEAARTTLGSKSGPAEDRAQPVEGRSRRTGGGSGPTTSIRDAGGAFTHQMTAETFREATTFPPFWEKWEFPLFPPPTFTTFPTIHFPTFGAAIIKSNRVSHFQHMFF